MKKEGNQTEALENAEPLSAVPEGISCEVKELCGLGFIAACNPEGFFQVLPLKRLQQ